MSVTAGILDKDATSRNKDVVNLFSGASPATTSQGITCKKGEKNQIAFRYTEWPLFGVLNSLCMICASNPLEEALGLFF